MSGVRAGEPIIVVRHKHGLPAKQPLLSWEGWERDREVRGGIGEARLGQTHVLPDHGPIPTQQAAIHPGANRPELSTLIGRDVVDGGKTRTVGLPSNRPQLVAVPKVNA